MLLSALLTKNVIIPVSVGIGGAAVGAVAAVSVMRKMHPSIKEENAEKKAEKKAAKEEKKAAKLEAKNDEKAEASAEVVEVNPADIIVEVYEEVAPQVEEAPQVAVQTQEAPQQPQTVVQEVARQPVPQQPQTTTVQQPQTTVQEAPKPNPALNLNINPADGTPVPTNG